MTSMSMYLRKSDMEKDVARMDVDDLAEEIRRVDGSNSLGAGALAEALMPFILRAVAAEREACAEIARSEPRVWDVKAGDPQHRIAKRIIARCPS